MTQDELKQAVARAAIDYVVKNEIIGGGTGSTANFFIDELAKIKADIKGAVASSEATAARLRGHGIEVFDLNDVPEIAVYIDGADEITHTGAMIKGGGAALTRELAKLGGEPKLRLKPGTDEAFITDNGGMLIDVAGLAITDPVALEAKINQIVGVVAVGLFAARGANVCLLGTAEGVKTLKF